MSISAETYALDWSIDGKESKVTIRITDTAGNPVPEGTKVQFSASGGQIQTSCALTGVANGSPTISSCSVTFATQNPRPANGYVAVQAWLEGNEAYLDLNGNGQYDAGEPFYDTGRLYRDDDVDGAFTSGVDELDLGGTASSSTLGIGTSSCGVNVGSSGLTPAQVLSRLAFSGINLPSSVDNTCDGVWGKTLVRARTYFAVSDPRDLRLTDPDAAALSDVYGSQVPGRGELVVGFVQLSSGGLSSAPAGTTLSVVSAPTGCTMTVSPSTVASTQIAPSLHTLQAATPASCPAGSTVVVKATFDTLERLGSITLR